MTNKIENTINLESFIAIDKKGNPAKVFTGRDRGESVRKESKIDEIEKNSSEVNIIIPDNIYSINPSFFEGLFLNVVIKLGRDGFFKKFKFQSLGKYPYSKPLNEAIDRILRKKTAIG